MLNKRGFDCEVFYLSHKGFEIFRMSQQYVLFIKPWQTLVFIKGMTFLHNSVFESHGNLTSGECHVDSRWVLKIGGFALNSFKGEKEYAEVFIKIVTFII